MKQINWSTPTKWCIAGIISSILNTYHLSKSWNTASKYDSLTNLLPTPLYSLTFVSCSNCVLLCVLLHALLVLKKLYYFA